MTTIAELIAQLVDMTRTKEITWSPQEDPRIYQIKRQGYWYQISLDGLWVGQNSESLTQVGYAMDVAGLMSLILSEAPQLAIEEAMAKLGPSSEF